MYHIPYPGEGKFNRCSETPGVMCVKCSCSLLLPFLDRSVRVPHIVLGDSGEQGDRERMEVQLLQDVVDQIVSWL